MIGVLVAWGVLTGICEVVAAARLPRAVAAHWFVATGGASSIFLALVVLALPYAGSDRVALILAAYAIVFGIALDARWRVLDRSGSEVAAPSHACAKPPVPVRLRRPSGAHWARSVATSPWN